MAIITQQQDNERMFSEGVVGKSLIEFVLWGKQTLPHVYRECPQIYTRTYQKVAGGLHRITFQVPFTSQRTFFLSCSTLLIINTFPRKPYPKTCNKHGSTSISAAHPSIFDTALLSKQCNLHSRVCDTWYTAFWVHSTTTNPGCYKQFYFKLLRLIGKRALL